MKITQGIRYELEEYDLDNLRRYGRTQNSSGMLTVVHNGPYGVFSLDYDGRIIGCITKDHLDWLDELGINDIQFDAPCIDHIEK